MAWTDLKAAVAAVVKTNGANEVTGELLQQTLHNIIDNVGNNSSYAGVAVPSTNPGTPDGDVFYIASDPGTYANFTGYTNVNQILLFKWTEATGVWSMSVIGLNSIAIGEKDDAFIKINAAIGSSQYNQLKVIQKTIQSLYLSGPVDTTTYSYSLVIFQNDNSLSRIILYKEDLLSHTQSIICEFYKAQTTPRTGIELVYIPEYSTSGYYAVAVVDWDKASGVNYSGLFDNYGELTAKCFSEAHLNKSYYLNLNKEDRVSTILQQTTEVLAIDKAIGGVYISGVRNPDSIYFLQVYTNNTSFRRIRIFEWDGAASTEICSYAVAQNQIRTISEILRIPEYNSSGYSAIVSIDWSKLTGVDYFGLPTNYDKWYLNENAFNSRYFQYLESIEALQVLTTEQGIDIETNTANIEVLRESKEDRWYNVTTPTAPNLITITKIGKAIRSVWLDGSIDPLAVYCIPVYSNNSTYRRIRIYQVKDAVTTELCNLTIYHSAPRTVVETIDIPEYGGSGFTARVLVDWGQLQDVDYVGYFESTWVLASKCFQEVNFNYTPQNKDNIALLSGASKLTESLVDRISNLDLTNWTLVDGVLQSQATGWSNYAYYNKNLNEDKFTLAVKLKAVNVGDFEIGIGKRMSLAGTAVTLRKSGASSYICFYKMIDSAAPIESTSLRQTLAVQLLNDAEYMLRMTKVVNQLTVELIYPTGEIVTFSTENLSEKGSEWGYPTIYCITGQCEASFFNFRMPYKRDPKILIFGDSFIEGNSIAGSKGDRYAAILAAELGEDKCILLGKGGETTGSGLTRIYQQIDWYSKSAYCLIALGTNDTVFGTYQTNINALMTYLKNRYITPILVTVTKRLDVDNSAFIAQVNPWVRASGEKYIDMYAAVTDENGDWKTGYLLGDGVHPSVTGHLYMYRRILFDAQYLLD